MKTPRGFIAVISAVVISTILLGLAVAAGSSTFSARMDALNSEYKRVSLGLAESCIHAALLKIGQNYLYTVPSGGESIQVGSGTCLIKAPTTTPLEVNGKRTYNLVTQGQYKGAFSNVSVSAIAQSPTSTPVVPPPTCALTVTPTSIPQGQSTTFGWNTAGGATSFSIDHGVGSQAVPSGTLLYSPPASPGAITYTGTATNAGGSNTCTATLTITAPPPSPSCADTVMMLDRTASMSSSDLSNEITAAKQLVDLYRDANPPGQLGVGRFGDDLTRISADFLGLLGTVTSTYATTLKNAIQSGIVNNTSYTNLADAISIATDPTTGELNSVRHDAGKGKVLILISDGMNVNQPTQTYHPTNYVSSDSWQNRPGAYTGGDASVATDAGGHSQRYYDFNIIPTPPNSVLGIEVDALAWSTLNPAPTSVQRPPAGATPIVWSNPDRAFTSNDSYATSVTTGQAQNYSAFSFSIPSNATITGIQVTTEAKIVGFGASAATGTLTPNGPGTFDDWAGDESDIDETGSVQCGSSDGNENVATGNTNDRLSVNLDLSGIPDGSNITSVSIIASYTDDTSSGSDGTFRTFARISGGNTDAGANLIASGSSSSSCNHTDTQVINIPDTIKSGSTDLEIGVVKTSTDTSSVWVGALRAIVTYQPAVTGSIAIALSSNNGGVWTAPKSTALDAVESPPEAPAGNNATDLWGRTWVPADFNNGNFALRVTNGSASGAMVSLDHVLVTVNYTAPPVSASCQFGMDISHNGGSNWYSLSNEVIPVGATTLETVFGGAYEDWGRNWGTGDFQNGSTRFMVRARNIAGVSAACDAATLNIDSLKVKVHVTDTTAYAQAQATAAANAAKADATQIFTIHYGDPAGQAFLQTLTSLSTLTAATITTATRSGGTATITTSAPHKLVKNQRVVVSGVSGCAAFNQTVMITAVPLATTFQYSIPSSGCSNGSGGTASPTNLFIAPDSNAMSSVFNSIGLQVCPAAAPACSNTVDDDSDGVTDYDDPGCHTDGDVTNPSSYDAADNDEWQSSGTPVAPPPPPPPPSINIGSWQETP